MTTRQIIAIFKEIYDAHVLASLILTASNTVIKKVNEWQANLLVPVYVIVYLNCIVVKI